MRRVIPAALIVLLPGVVCLLLLPSQAQTRDQTEHRRILAPAEIAAQAEELTAQLASRDAAKARSARRALVALHASLVEGIADRSRNFAPRHRKRARDLLHDIACRANTAHALAALPEAQRTKLAAFQARLPKIARDAFSPEWHRRLKTVRAIGLIGDPHGLAEPALIAALRHGSNELAFAAAGCVATGTYRSPFLVEALTDVLVRNDPEAWEFVMRVGPTTSAQTTVLSVARAIGRIASKDAAPTLVALMLRQAPPNSARDAGLAEALWATRDRRAIPYLIRMLVRVERSYRYADISGIRQLTVDMAPSDAALMALIELTGQSSDDYGFKRVPPVLAPGPATYGFASDGDRQAAIARFEAWWERNKARPGYRSLKPIPLPRLPGLEH